MHWFGEPWPSAELRAPVCEDDADKVPVPIGGRCAYCDKRISNRDQGVVIPHMGSEVVETYWHLGCFLWSIGAVT